MAGVDDYHRGENEQRETVVTAGSIFNP